jgi:hypothetical protein
MKDRNWDQEDKAVTIDRNLKRVFRDAEDEPLPDRFAVLLEQLRRQQQAAQQGESAR